MFDPDQFTKWLRHARRGDKVCYYEGFIMQDRGSDNKDQRSDTQKLIARLADLVWTFHKQGAISLVQKRRGPFVYSYFAQKR